LKLKQKYNINSNRGDINKYPRSKVNLLQEYLSLFKEVDMPKGIGNKRDSKKKPAASLKEKRLRKREKRFKHEEHSIDQVVE
jgi:hypothetical protein